MITNIEDQLIRDEGKSLVPYLDTTGKWTIGIGHLLGDQVPPMYTDGISDSLCDQLFQVDLKNVNNLLSVHLPWVNQLSPAVLGVLQNMGFNLGVTGLLSFHEFLGYVQSQWWQKATSDLRTTKVYKQLHNRYERLARQLETGIWQ